MFRLPCCAFILLILSFSTCQALAEVTAEEETGANTNSRESTKDDAIRGEVTVEFAKRKKAWETWLDAMARRGFPLDRDDFGLLPSLAECKSQQRILLLYDPQRLKHVTIRFLNEDRTVLEIERSFSTAAFVTYEDGLYLAEFSRGGAGCKLKAYNLNTGKKLWERQMEQALPLGHSAYSNRVFVRVVGSRARQEKHRDSVVVYGRESYCDYIQVLDRATGKTLAIKNFRVGFGSKDSEESKGKVGSVERLMTPQPARSKQKAGEK